MFSMQLVFYKISLGHLKTRSKSLSRALLQFEHTNAQHTGIWWLPRPTFCQAAPFVIILHWRCYCSHSLEWSCDSLEISVNTNCQSSPFYFSHFVSHWLEWSFDISDELEHLKPSFEIIQLWWRYNIVHSFGVFIWNTQHIQSANKLLSHTYLALAEHSLLLTSQEDLKLQFEIIFVFLTLCFTLVGVIIWESQRIQTRTLLFLTLFVEWSFGNLKAYKLLKLALLYT